MPNEAKLTRLLLGLCALLALLNGAEWYYLDHAIDRSRQSINRPVKSDLLFEKISKQEFVLPPKEKYSESVERPLMIQGRRPVPEVVEEPFKPPPAPVAKIQIKLMGIIMTPDGMTALLQDAKGAYKNLPINGAIDGWELNELHPDRVVLTQADVREELKLRKPKSKKPIRTPGQKPPPNQKSMPNPGQPFGLVPVPGQPGPALRMRRGGLLPPAPIPQAANPESE